MLVTLTGATSKAGIAIANRLRSAGTTVRGTAHLRPEAASEQASSSTIPVDYLQPNTLAPAFAGADAAVLVPPLETSLVEATRNLVVAAERAEVEWVVLISHLHAGNSQGGTLLLMHHGAEKIVEASRITSTCLRPNFYMQNFLNPHRPVSAARNGLISFIDARDLADVVLTVLTDGGHEDKTYSLTGPRAYSISEVLQLFEGEVCPPVGT